MYHEYTASAKISYTKWSTKETETETETEADLKMPG